MQQFRDDLCKDAAHRSDKQSPPVQIPKQTMYRCLLPGFFFACIEPYMKCMIAACGRISVKGGDRCHDELARGNPSPQSAGYTRVVGWGTRPSWSPAAFTQDLRAAEKPTPRARPSCRGSTPSSRSVRSTSCHLHTICIDIVISRMVDLECTSCLSSSELRWIKSNID